VRLHPGSEEKPSKGGEEEENKDDKAYKSEPVSLKKPPNLSPTGLPRSKGFLH
jgi:hypothetical protein